MGAQNPQKLLQWCQSGQLEPSDLTFAIEQLGYYPEALPYLLETLAFHESSLVREGALNGLINIKCEIWTEIESAAQNDPSEGVREVAANIADSWY